jgi:hypothetical protein
MLKVSRGEGMGFESGFDEKIDVIDLIINVLKDHEKQLDELVARLEEALAAEAPKRTPQERELIEREPAGGATVTASLKKWTEFTGRCASAGLVAFKFDECNFKVMAMAGGALYTYEEEIPEMEIHYKKVDEKVHINSVDISSAKLVPTALRGRLDCGLGFEKNEVEVELPYGDSVYKVIYSIDPGTARNWIAYQLGVEEDSIVQGELII